MPTLTVTVGVFAAPSKVTLGYSRLTIDAVRVTGWMVYSAVALPVKLPVPVTVTVFVPLLVKSVGAAVSLFLKSTV